MTQIKIIYPKLSKLLKKAKMYKYSLININYGLVFFNNDFPNTGQAYRRLSKG